MASARRAAANQSRSSTGRSLRRSLLLSDEIESGAAPAAHAFTSSRLEGTNDNHRGSRSSATMMRRFGTSDTLDREASESDPLLPPPLSSTTGHAPYGARSETSRNGDDHDDATSYNYSTRRATFDAAAATADLPRQCAQESIFPLLQRVRNDVRATIDTHLDWQELTALDVNYAVVRPLTLKYSNLAGENSIDVGTTHGNVNLSIIFVFLVNRVQFQREAERDLALQNVNNTRAALCELLAMKLLRRFARDGLQLITALTYPFSTFQGAPHAVLAAEGLLDKQSGSDAVPQFGPGHCTSALELAIVSRAKKFIKTPLCQRCVAGIYDGRVVVSYQATHAIVDDSYKKRPLGIYNPATAPILDHHRLRVPLIRNRIEFCNFCVLLLLYVWCLSKKKSPTWTLAETIFTVWLFGFALDEVTQMQEHGVRMYISALYNILDAMFCIVSFVWLGLRIAALAHGNPAQSALSFETLSIGAILLCPRVASVLVQDNVILLALKAMLFDFCFFMTLAVVCFSGFLYTFYTISGPEWSVGQIVWIMVKVWFGNSYVGFDTAQSISPIFGPPLMVFFAVMANTLLLTILISLLSNTFSIVAQNAVEEAMYQFACKTVAGISSEALISYTPPLNLVGLVVMVPASFVLSPRYLHKANVYLLRLTSWPILLLIRFSSHVWPPSGHWKQRGNGENLVAGNGTGGTVADRTSQLISYLPLPRSRSSPDRDMIQAAFMHSATLANAAHAEQHRRNDGDTDTADVGGQNVKSSLQQELWPDSTWDEEEWSSSMLPVPTSKQDELARQRAQQTLPPSIRTAPTSSTAHTPKPSFAPGTPTKRIWRERSTSGARESPLARLFSRAFGSASGNDAADSIRHHAQVPQTAQLPLRSRYEANDNEQEQNSNDNVNQDSLIDEDAVNADQAGATNDSGGPASSVLHTYASSSSSAQQNDEAPAAIATTLEEQATTHGLVLALTDRLNAQEERQKRIEQMLERLLHATASTS